MLSALTKDAGKCDVMDMMTRKPRFAVVSTLFKQTTQDKVILITCEDVPQTIMAAAYWFMSPSTSSFVVLFNILFPILRITFAVVAYHSLRRLAQPWLWDELPKAMRDGNEVKMSYVMKHIIMGGSGDYLRLSNTGITDRITDGRWRIVEALSLSDCA